MGSEMPHIDRRAGELVMRIVYDGAPEAGKTTNVRQLGEAISLKRRGGIATPGSPGRRTEFFDWLDFAGGYMDGRRVRCQVVSVPGQPELLRRRRYLLDTADAVIFVADSRQERLRETRRDFDLLSRTLARVGDPPVGLLVQANKQDLSGALGAEEIAGALGVDERAEVLLARAHVGEGVMQAFVSAVRLATDRIRALIREDRLPDLPAGAASAESLHAALLDLEEQLPAAPTKRDDRASEDLAASLPQASDVRTGAMWPPAKGRESLGAVPRRELRPCAEPCAWAPRGASELRAGSWILHTSEQWKFEEEAAARQHLLLLVRGLLSLEGLIPAGRTFFVGPEQNGWRLWMQTPRVSTLAEDLDAACERGDAGALTAVCERVVRAAALFAATRVPAEVIALDAVAAGEDAFVTLALPAERPAPAGEDAAAGLALEARQRVERWLGGRPDLRAAAEAVLHRDAPAAPTFE